MTQRLLSLFIILQLCLAGAAAAAPASAGQQKNTPQDQLQQGLDCLERADLSCAQKALATIPAQSAHARLLSGRIAVVEGDTGRALRLLEPLQNESGLAPAAIDSLHASLALAYEKQSDILLALNQRMLLDARLAPDGDEALNNQQHILSMLTGMPRSQLITLRGESTSTAMQGWVDLALALGADGNRQEALASWQLGYPDQRLAPSLLQQEAPPTPSGAAATVAAGSELQGPIALILPFAVEDFYPAADAIERGFVAAQAQAKNDNALKIYATHGNPADIAAIYSQAISEGAHYVVGPLTRNEVTALTSVPLAVPTLALNEPEAAVDDAKLHALGLSVETEARQVADLARGYGMQTATIVASDNPLGSHMANAFSAAWTSSGGQLVQQVVITRMSDLEDLRRKADEQPTDMVFIAANAAEARAIRPHINLATPTFALSHVYSGLPHDPLDKPLLAVRFVDMPWLLNPDDPAFAVYREAAADLPPGKMQRWFALGVDAFYLLRELVRHPQQSFSLSGLTGRIDVAADGRISRELAAGSFGNDGVVLESAP
jgi:outer membrane PBP1 activator LpoA protein